MKARSLHNLVIQGIDSDFPLDGQKGVIALDSGTSNNGTSDSSFKNEPSGSKSVTSSDKISNFGKAHIRQKSMKTKWGYEQNI